MWNLADRLPSPPTLLRIGLVVFVLAWLFAPYEFQSAIPIWLPFLIALGLEVHFFVSALREPPTQRPDRGPQSADRERYGYGDDAEELLLVRDQDQELWIPYSGERGEELEALLDDARELAEEEPVAIVETEPERERMRLPPPALRRRARPDRRARTRLLVRREPHRLERARREHTRRGGGALLPGGLTDRGEAGDDPL